MSMAKATKKSQVYLRTKRMISVRNRMFKNTVWERFPCEEALIQEPMFETHASLPTTVRGIRGTRTIFCYPLIQRNTSSKHLLWASILLHWFDGLKQRTVTWQCLVMGRKETWLWGLWCPWQSRLCGLVDPE